MNRSCLWLLLVAAACACAGEAQRGQALVRNELHCLTCHSTGREGGQTAPDLSQALVTNYSPAALASDLWNHTPAMWQEMSNQVIARPLATDAEWEDVFAYLYWLRFPDRRGNAQRGQEVFRTKQCAACHSTQLPSSGTGTGVPTWNIVSDPVSLLEEMWKHATAMRGEARERRKGWQKLTARDLVDLTAYVQSVQKVSPAAQRFSLPQPSEGKAPFEQNCGRCHRGNMSLTVRLANKTWMDIGAGIWNHVPIVGPIRDIPAGDMRKILAYAWEQQYEGAPGNRARGRQVFESKHCVVCHVDATPRAGKTFTPFSMVALGWSSGRAAHSFMSQKGISWPYLTARDISDLVAYFNSRK